MTETHELNSEVAHEQGATMPQLNPEFFSEQLIWLVLTFTFLYVMMSRIALPRIGAVLEERQDKIADDLDKAAEFKREAEESLAAYQSSLADARAKAHAIAAASREKVKAETDEMRAQSEIKLAKHLESAEARIRESRDEAMSHVREVACQISVVLYKKLTGQSMELSLAEAAIDAQLVQGESLLAK